jgi:hypothetical protein
LDLGRSNCSFRPRLSWIGQNWKRQNTCVYLAIHRPHNESDRTFTRRWTNCVNYCSHEGIGFTSEHKFLLFFHLRLNLRFITKLENTQIPTILRRFVPMAVVQNMNSKRHWKRVLNWSLEHRFNLIIILKLI